MEPGNCQSQIRSGSLLEYPAWVTLADMILSHHIINTIGIENSTAILDAEEEDCQLSPELRARAEKAAQLLEHELGEFAAAAQEFNTVLKGGLEGLKA